MCSLIFTQELKLKSSNGSKTKFKSTILKRKKEEPVRIQQQFLAPMGRVGSSSLKKMPIQRAGDHLAFLQAIFMFFVLTPIKLLFFLSSTPNCVYQQVLKFLFKFIGTSRGKRMKLSASIERHGPHCKIAANFHFNPPKPLLVLFRKRMKGGNEVF